VLHAEVVFNNVVQQEHVLNELYRLTPLCSLKPAQMLACMLYLVLRLANKVSCDTVCLTFSSHPFWDWSALLLYPGKVLVVLVSVEKQFTCLNFNQYALHWPNVIGFVPSKGLEDHIRGSILTIVDYQRWIFSDNSRHRNQSLSRRIFFVLTTV
jgi:hypothetical protein